MTPTDTELLAQVVAELKKLNERLAGPPVEVLSLEQAAAELECSPRQVYRLVESGRLTAAERAGKKKAPQFFLADIRAFQRGSKEAPRAAQNEPPASVEPDYQSPLVGRRNGRKG